MGLFGSSKNELKCKKCGTVLPDSDRLKKHQEKVDSFSPQNLVLSKGHASFGYYAFLHAFKYFSESELKSVCKLNSKFYYK